MKVKDYVIGGIWYVIPDTTTAGELSNGLVRPIVRSVYRRQLGNLSPYDLDVWLQSQFYPVRRSAVLSVDIGDFDFKAEFVDAEICKDCKGTKQYIGFNVIEPCKTCCGPAKGGLV
jgi:hypothetical protein